MCVDVHDGVCLRAHGGGEEVEDEAGPGGDGGGRVEVDDDESGDQGWTEE